MAHPIRPIDRDRLAPPPRNILSLPDRAEDDLRRIRETMAASRTFTHISGPTLIGLGGLGLVAAILGASLEARAGIARATPGVAYWTTWGVTAVIAFVVGFLSIDRRARRPGDRVGSGILRGPGRRFTFGMLPALAAGAVITIPLLDGGGRWVPGLWLVLYGVAHIAGGMTSLVVVRVLGAAFFLLGAVALNVTNWGPLCLAVGFGGLHVVFGIWITVREPSARVCGPRSSEEGPRG